jgi:outer membrane receptor for ferric coprogen and ferric-rhodotorulic acid
MATRRCLHLLSIVVGWLCGLSALAADTGKGAEPYTLRIESLPLEQSLQELARQSGIQVVFFSEVTEGLTAPALAGEYSLSKALDTLLAGSDLEFRVIAPRTVQILPRALPRAAEPSRVAPPSSADRNIIARATAGALTGADVAEVTISASAAGLTATRTETPLREIPQTFSILSQEQLRQQNVTTLDEALAKAPGITAVRRSSLEQGFFSRGFGVSELHVDGSSALNAQSIAAQPFFGSPDLSEFERIEVMRGADALFGSDGSPGATVNLIRKRPLNTFAASLSGWVASWNNYRVEGDLTGPLMASDRVRGRLVGVYADQDYFFATADSQRKKIFGALQADLTPDTLLTVGGSYEWDRATPFMAGWFMYADGSDSHLPRNAALAFDWAHYDTDSREIYFQLDQAFGPAWRLRLSGVSLYGNVRYAYGTMESSIDRGTRALRDQAQALYSAAPGAQRQIALDVTLTGALLLFGRPAELAVGADLSRFHVHRADLEPFLFGPVLDDVLDFNPADFPDPLLTEDFNFVAAQRQRTNLHGVFGSLRIYATDALSLVGGLRVSNGHYVVEGNFYLDNELIAAVGGDTRDKNKFTPYAGVVYELDPVYSVYASYADIYKSVAYAATWEGVPLRPADGVVIEGGIKSAWRGGALNGSLALYRIRQSGLPESDPRPRPPGSTSRCCFTPSGASRSKGVDIEISGALLRDWLIGAGYSYNVNHEVDRSSQSVLTPRHLLKLWTNVTLPGVLHRWDVGGSLHAQSRISSAGTYCARYTSAICVEPDTPYALVQSAYATLDLRASFAVDAHWRAALTVANVFDKRYYESIDWPAGGNWYGQPRSVLLRFDARY